MYELRVLTGLHRGAALPLIGQQWNLGNDDNADLALFDPGIRPKHCRLIQLENGWGLESEQGKITDNEGHKVDKIDLLSVNASFALSGIWMSIVDANTPWQQYEEDELITQNIEDASNSPKKTAKSPKRTKSLINFTLGFLSAGAIVATSTWASLNTSSFDKPQATKKQEETKPAEQLLPNLSTEPEVISQLRTMLQARELDSLVQVKSSNNQIVINGAIDDSDRDRLTRMLKRFNKQFYTSIKITNQTSELPVNLPFKIVQITSGSMGSVVTNTGKRLFVGDELNGMRLMSVSENKIIFKGKQDYEVNW